MANHPTDLPAAGPRLHHVVATVAFGWGAFTALMALYWALGGPGLPFGHNDLDAPDYSSLLAGSPRPAIAAGLLVHGLVVCALAARLGPDRAGPDRAGPGRAGPDRPVTVTAVAAMVLAVGVVALAGDARLITLLPPLGLLAVKWLGVDWPTLFQVLVATGSTALFLSAAATLVARRGTGPGRVRDRWVRAGTVATWVAMACPLPYAVIRLCWSRGWPVGAPEPFVESLLRNQPENVWIEPLLAAFAIGGSALTWGLVRPWGRRFPRWLPGLRGRTVPLWFPLGLGASAVLSIWSFGRVLLQGELGLRVPGQVDDWQAWGQPLDGAAYWGAGGLGWVLFPLWAVALAVALAGYWFRYAPPRPPAGAGSAARAAAPTAPTPRPQRRQVVRRRSQ